MTDSGFKTYLITGASGIGAETARLLARNGQGGVRIFLAALEEDQCSELAGELRSLGVGAAFLAGDLCNPEFASAAVRACIRSFGRIDGLFSVAGTSGRRFGDGPLHECTEQGWARTIEANLTTQYRVCRETVKAMLAQPLGADGQRGVLLNMSSILALHPEPVHFDTIAYAASKGGILAMSRTMAASYAASGIRVNAIAPGLVCTRMSRRASSDQKIVDAMRGKQPLAQGLMSAADVAASCVYLLTSASRPVTGQVIEVDGGWGLR